MSILVLPNELIFKIIDYLGFEDPSSLHFALTCRCLYDIVMPQVLRDEENHLDDMIQGSGYLSVLDSSSKTPERRGWGTLPEPPETTQLPEVGLTALVYRVRNVARGMRCVHRLIHSSKTLQTVELRLDDFEIPRILSSTQQAKEVRNLASFIASIASRPGLSLIITGQLDALVGSEGGPFIFKILPLKSSEPPGSPHPKPAELPSSQPSRGPRWLAALRAMQGSILACAMPTTFGRYFVSEIKPSTTPSAPITPRLSTISLAAIPQPRPPRYDTSMWRRIRPCALKGITIHTSTLFQASLYPFTLQLLNNSPITMVELQGVGLGLFDWSKILPAITLPCLTNLAIGDLQVAFQDLSDFLDRHPLISVLSFVGSNLIGVFQPPTLPRLRSVAGNAEYLVPFLDNIHKYSELASINLVTAVPPGSSRGSGHAFSGDQSYPVFERVSRLPAGKFNLIVYSLDDSGIFRWVRSSNVEKHTFPSIKELAFQKNELADVASAIAGSDCKIFLSEQEQREFVRRFVWKAFPQLGVLWLCDAEIYHEGLHSLGRKPPAEASKQSEV